MTSSADLLQRQLAVLRGVARTVVGLDDATLREILAHAAEAGALAEREACNLLALHVALELEPCAEAIGAHRVAKRIRARTKL